MTLVATLFIDPESITPWFLLVAAACAALTGVTGVVAFIFVWAPKTNIKAREWFHEFTGAGPALRATEANTAAVQCLGTQLETFGNELTANREAIKAVDEKGDQRHADNTTELGALSGNLERTATALNRFTDEHTAEAEMRNQAIEAVGTLARETAVQLLKHERSRTKHVTRVRKSASSGA